MPPSPRMCGSISCCIAHDNATLLPDKVYRGALRIYLLAARTVISRTEPTFAVHAAVLSAAPPTDVTLHLGVQRHTMVVVPDQRTGQAHSQVYVAEVPTPQADFQYVVVASFAGGEAVAAPVAGNQSVVVL